MSRKQIAIVTLFPALVLSLLLRTDAALAAGAANGEIPPTLARLGYYLPKHVIEVSGSVTKETASVAVPGPAGSTWTTEKCDERVTEFAVSFADRVVADRTYRYPLKLDGGLFTSIEYDIGLTADGRLTSLNATATGKTGEFLRSVGSLVGKLLPLFGSLNVAPTKDQLCANPGLAQEQLMAFYTSFPKNKKLVDDIEARKKVLSQRLGELEEHRFQLQLAIADARAAKIDANVPGDVAHAVDAYAKSIKSVEQYLATLGTAKKQLQAVVDAGLERFKKRNGLLTIGWQQKVAGTVNLASLPRWCDTSGVDCIRPDLGKADTIRAIQANDAADPDERGFIRWLFDQTGVVIALKAAEASSQLLSAKQRKAVSDSVTSRKSSTNEYFFTRDGRSAELALFQYGARPTEFGGIGDERLALKKHASTTLLFPDQPPSVISLKKSAFAKRQLKLEMSDIGTLQKISRVKEAAAPAVASALGDATSNALSGYLSTANQLSEINKAKSTLALADTQAEIDRLQKEKELIDATIAQEGAEATSELAAQRIMLDAQIAQLTAQANANEQQLLVLRSGDQLANYVAEPAEIQQLQSQLALLQAQASLAAAQPGELMSLQADLARRQVQSQIAALQSPPDQLQILEQELAILRVQVEILELKKQLDGTGP